MPYWRGEGGGGGHYKKHTTISVLAMCVVLCTVTLSDNTYVHVHVCGSARSGGGAHVKWMCHMEAHDNWK